CAQEASFTLDVRGSDDGPPSIDLRSLKGGERVGRLLFAGKYILTEFSELRTKSRVGEGIPNCRVKLGNAMYLWAPKMHSRWKCTIPARRPRPRLECRVRNRGASWP